jgi:AcrR family transcriptional regulator
VTDTTPPVTSRRGPRRQGDARADIVAAARRLFAERGYDGTSLRAVARAAGVDPALVHHYFEGKPQLYSLSIGLDLDPLAVRSRILAAGPDQVPESLLRVFLAMWEDPAGRERFRSVIANLATRPEAAAAYRQFVTSALLGPVAAAMGVDHAAHRAALVGSQMIGLALARYVVAIEPLASLPAEAVVADVAPTLRRYLTDTRIGVDTAPGGASYSSHDE